MDTSEQTPDDGELTGTGPILPAKHTYDGPAWHYTDASGLVGIVAGGDCRHGILWATAATILNDPDELRYGARRVIEWFDQPGNGEAGGVGVHLAIRHVLSDLEERIAANPAYVVCASTDPDLLTNWRGYAGGGGYAVKLDTIVEYSIVGRPHHETSFSLAPTWVKVAYSKQEQDSLISGVFDYMLDERTLVGRIAATDDARATGILVRALLSGLATALKDPSFTDEREVRLIAFPHESVIPKFRGTARGVVPYIEIETAIFPDLAFPHTPTPMPIEDVWVGPPRGEAMEQRARTVRMLLDSTERKSVPVNDSKIPFIP